MYRKVVNWASAAARDVVAKSSIGPTVAAGVAAATVTTALVGLVCGVLAGAVAASLLSAAVAVVASRRRRETLTAAHEAGHRNEEVELRLREARYRTIFESAEVGIAVVDAAGALVDCNERFESMLLPSERQALLDDVRVLAEEGASRKERRFFRAGGDVVWVELALSRIENADFAPFVLCMVQDVTERKHGEERLNFEATHDALTGLANRFHFESILDEAFQSEKRGAKFALFFVDLDGFKYINDTFGHHAGDMVIKLVGKRLRASVSSNDLVARFGGDEFAVLVRGVERNDVALGIAERIHNNVTVPFKVESRPVAINASIGIVLSAERYKRPEDLMRDADSAMFAAKANRSGYVLFDAAHQVVDMHRLELQSDLLTALQRHEFFVVYQPIARLDDGATLGYEALLRWEHPKQGVVLPGIFIPMLEQVGLIRSVGQWMIREACGEFAWLRDRHPERPDLFLHLNVSVSELFGRGFERNLLSAVAANRLSPESIVIEITESGMLETGQRTDNVLARLKAEGFRLCIDDFGTGYSSLGYLQRLDLDSIKIDRSFVATEGGGIASEPIVKTLVTLADAFGVAIIAEGVETAAQRDFLLNLGCRDAQGWLFGRPQRATDLAIPPSSAPSGS